MVSNRSSIQFVKCFICFVWAFPPSIIYFDGPYTCTVWSSNTYYVCREVLCHLTFWVVYLLYVMNTLRDRTYFDKCFIHFYLQIDMLRYVWHILWQNKDYVIYAMFLLVYFFKYWIPSDMLGTIQSNHEMLLIIYCSWIKWAILIDNYTKNREKKYCSIKYFN